MSEIPEARTHPDRRAHPRGGRRATDRPWTPSELAEHIGMSSGFVLAEIRCKELAASQFGREYRIHHSEVLRYLAAKGWPPAAHSTS